jgi:miniconductance mechanosensitive channel
LYRSWLEAAIPSESAVAIAYCASMILCCAALSVLAYKLGKWLIYRGSQLLGGKSDIKIVKTLKQHKLFSYLSYYLPLLVFKLHSDAIFADFGTTSKVLGSAYKILAIILLVLVINSILSTLVAHNQQKGAKRSKPIRGLVQFAQIVIYFFAAVACIAVLLDKSPAALMAGLGAASALVMLIFKDSITSLVAGVQLSLNSVLQVGDWVSLPRYDADGEIVDITLTSVKIRNWDNSVSTVPTYSLVVSDSVKNWRPMKDSGARRILRTLFVDVHSVQRCTAAALERYGAAVGANLTVADPDERLTNLGALRRYLYGYLEHRQGVRQDLGVVMRQQQQPNGSLALEVVCWANTTDTRQYEDMQSDIFDHLVAIAPAFDLRLWQAAAVANG